MSKDFTNDIETKVCDLKSFMYEMYKEGMNYSFSLCEKLIKENLENSDELIEKLQELIINEELDINFKKSMNSENISTEALASIAKVSALTKNLT